jgi:ADP-ribosyl-[dinitrogen reductase] hydrolase
MLIELAIGDAYGAGYEYVDARLAKQNQITNGYVRHPRHAIVPGAYTDDTQMTLAIAEVIVEGKPWTAEVLATAFVQTFQRDPREGYAQGFYHFLQSIKSGEEFLAKIRPDSDKSGAAMRACPLGIFPTVEEVIAKCTLQARLTHDTADGISAAVATSLLTHYFLYDLGPKADVGTFLEKYVPVRQWSKPWQGKVGSKGWMSVWAAITAICAHTTLGDILQTSIAFGGDVDTVATIALGSASCSREIINDLPPLLYDGLEEGTYGKTYLQTLDKQFLSLVNRNFL